MTRRDFLRLVVVARRPAATGTVARIDRDLCIAWAEGPCRMCETRCPKRGTALRWEQGPVIDPATCDGCGKCVEACATATLPCAIALE